MDSLHYAPFMKILARVEVRGKCIFKGKLDGFQEYWTEMRVVKTWKWGEKEEGELSKYAKTVRRININEACDGLIAWEKDSAICRAIGKSEKQEEQWINKMLRVWDSK